MLNFQKRQKMVASAIFCRVSQLHQPYFQARFKEKNMLNLWQNFLDYQAREFTIVEYDAPLLEPYFQW